MARSHLVPRWKTLLLEDWQGVWLGRIKYTRRVSTGSSYSGAIADWQCSVQIPAEHADKLMECWKKLWCQQLRTQVSQADEAIENAAASTATNYMDAKRPSRFLTKAILTYSTGEEQAIQNWVARFKYEFPWPVEFEKLDASHPDRLRFKNLRNTEELMQAMAAGSKESAVTEGDALHTVAETGIAEAKSAPPLTFHKRVHMIFPASPPIGRMKMTQSCSEIFSGLFPSQEALDAAVADHRAWIHRSTLLKSGQSLSRTRRRKRTSSSAPRCMKVAGASSRSSSVVLRRQLFHSSHLLLAANLRMDICRSAKICCAQAHLP